MHNIDALLNIYGDGNIFEKIKKLVEENNLQQKVLLKGKVVPDELNTITQQAYIGINLVEPAGLNQIYSLANKFFDYVQADVPQVTMNFPEYKKINDEFEVAVLVYTVDETEIATAVNLLLDDAGLYNKLRQNCKKARTMFNWQQEEKKLITFYNSVFAE
jgi:glycosyltransferase involved in cell wall biosynthesis